MTPFPLSMLSSSLLFTVLTLSVTNMSDRCPFRLMRHGEQIKSVQMCSLRCTREHALLMILEQWNNKCIQRLLMTCSNHMCQWLDWKISWCISAISVNKRGIHTSVITIKNVIRNPNLNPCMFSLCKPNFLPIITLMANRFKDYTITQLNCMISNNLGRKM